MACSFQNFVSMISENKFLASSLLIFAFVGLLDVAIKTFSFVSVIADLWLLPARSLTLYGANKGAWALITGASDGIGKEYAFQLARKGFNVALVSRTESKLVALKLEIEQKYKVKVKYLALDALSTDILPLKKFVAEVGGITVLINNVGQSHSIPVPFLETAAEEQNAIIKINVTGTLDTTQIVAPQIVSNVKSGLARRGLILTMGSFAGLTPTPYLATYSGSKAFLQSWSSALASELESSNVDVQLVISYLVVSAMSKIRRTSLLIPGPKQFVASALRSIGKRSGAQERYATTTPFWSHAFMHWGISTVVGVYSKLVAGINLNMHKDIRRRALKKAEREKKNM